MPGGHVGGTHDQQQTDGQHGRHDGPSIVATMRAARQAEINELLEELRQAKHDAAEIIGLAVGHVNSVHERLAEALAAAARHSQIAETGGHNGKRD